jgi:parallel beta-helix repeat protein
MRKKVTEGEVMRKIVLMVTLFSILTCSLHATTFYVAHWGDDAYNGLSWDSAFATLQCAADIVSAGDSVLTANGDYVGFDLRTGGNPSQPIVFSAFADSVFITVENSSTPDGINIENADWVVIDGFNVVGITRAGIRVALSEHVTIRNNHCTQNGRWGIFTGFADYAIIERNECSYSANEHGIYFSNSADHPIIRYNMCHHNYSCGIHMNGDESMGGDGLITDATVSCNIVFENGTGGGSGINCDGVAESRIFNNLLYMNHASGISLYQIDGAAGSYNDKIFNNTIINASDGRWCININTNSTGDTILNNILINLHSWRGSISIDSSSISGFFSDYNIVVDRFSDDGGNSNMTLAQWQSLGYDTHSMLADPLDSIFVDWQVGDYHLLQDAQAVDSGSAAVSSIVQYDLDSIPRPQGAGFDIGAYEYSGSGIDEYSNTVDLFRNCIVSCAKQVLFGNLRPGDRMWVYDVSGREIAASGPIEGNHYYWDASSCCAGLYFYHIQERGAEKVQKGKIVLIRGGAR